MRVCSDHILGRLRDGGGQTLPSFFGRGNFECMVNRERAIIIALVEFWKWRYIDMEVCATLDALSKLPLQAELRAVSSGKPE